MHFAQLRRLDASLLVGLYAKDLYAEKDIFLTYVGGCVRYAAHHFEEVQRICDRAIVGSFPQTPLMVQASPQLFGSTDSRTCRFFLWLPISTPFLWYLRILRLYLFFTFHSTKKAAISRRCWLAHLQMCTSKATSK